MPFGKKKKNPLGPDLNAAEANAAASAAGKKPFGAAKKSSPFKLGKGAAKGKPFGKR
jgi:hypothetical protein